ncbi:MAG: hypothetical protein K2L12_05465, partial [Clostridia bacterium]|nr:hypothetical protein [Clostridia bacterium]
MKITGTKKLLIIFLTLVCALTAGLFGVLFKGNNMPASAETSVVNADNADDGVQDGGEDKLVEPSQTPLEEAADEEQSEEQVVEEPEYDETYDEGYLHDAAELTGIRYDVLNLFAHVCEVPARTILENAEKNPEEVVEVVTSFAESYQKGEIYNDDSSVEEEDWFVAPDQMGTFGYLVGLQTEWVDYYTSKTSITTDDRYWGVTGFTMGNYWHHSPRNTTTAGQHFYYTWAWVEEGEEYEFGLKSHCAYGWVRTEAQKADTFFNTYLKGFWFTANSSAPGGYVGSDPNATSYNQYLEDYYTNTAPSTSYMKCSSGHNITSNSSSVIGSNYSTARAGYDIKMKVSADAPTGVYKMRFYAFYNSTNYWVCTWANLRGTSNNSGWNWGTCDSAFGDNSTSYYCDYIVILRRLPTSELSVELDSINVSADRLSKTEEYNGQPQSISLANDWGAGLINYSLYKSVLDPVTNTYSLQPATSTDIWFVSRPAIGSGTKGLMVFNAKDVGEYVIRTRSFRYNSSTGLDEWGGGSTSELEFRFIITPIYVQKPTLLEEEGVSGNTKYVNDTGQTKFINIHPILEPYLVVAGSTGLTLGTYADDGMFTCSATLQGTYTITVSIRYTSNIYWDNGTGNTPTQEDLYFYFTIGPQLIDVPDIIRDMGVNGNTKQVTYSGTTQTMSFMPVRSNQISASAESLTYQTTGAYNTVSPEEPNAGPDITTLIDSNVLTVRAQNADTYYIYVTPINGYGWKDVTGKNVVPGSYTNDISLSTLVFEFIIDPMKITAPHMEYEGQVTDYVEVTYGGETDTNGNTWVQRLYIQNCREERVAYKTMSLSQVDWGDTQLILSGRAAGEYEVTFECRRNYTWDDGVVPPTIKLKINKLAIDKPYLITDDGDTTASKKFGTNSKTVDFDFKEHFIMLWAGNSAAMNAEYDQSLGRDWKNDTGRVTFSGQNAGTYNIGLKPTSNYCWKGSNPEETIYFTFKITPIGIKALKYYYLEPYQQKYQEVWKTDDDGWLNVAPEYDGDEQFVRIGDGSDDAQTGYNNLWHFYTIVNAEGAEIENPASKGIRVSQGTGYLQVSVVNAGIYYIRIHLAQDNYAWNRWDSTVNDYVATDNNVILYKITVTPEKITAPALDIAGSHCADINVPSTATNSGAQGAGVYGVYWEADFILSIKLNYMFHDYIKVDYDQQNVTYISWTDTPNDDNLTFSAQVRGTHKITLSVKDPNYAWADSSVTEYTFVIHIQASPVSGLNFYYEEDGVYGAVENGENLMGGANIVLGDDFDEQDKHIRVDRYPTTSLAIIQTGFKAQFSAKVEGTTFDGDAISDRISFAYSADNGGGDTYIDFSVYHAGQYRITVWPNEDYCWNDANPAAENRTPVTLRLTIQKMTVEFPVVHASPDDAGETSENIDVNNSTKTIDYSPALDRSLTVKIGAYPDAFALKSWYGTAGQLVTANYGAGQTGGNTGKGYDLVNIGSSDAPVWLLSAKAKQTGDYKLGIVISNPNDYAWKSTSTELVYTLTINKLKVDRPQAYIVNNGTAYADVTNGRVLNRENGYSDSITYDGNAHVLYLLGDAVELGAVHISHVSLTTNGAIGNAPAGTPGLVYLPMGNGAVHTGTSYSDAAIESGDYLAYTLNATYVNTYTVTVTFKDGNYLWSDGDGTGSRVYTYAIAPRTLNLPKILGEESQLLVDDTYTKSFEYEANTNRTITVGKLDSASKSGAELGDFISTGANGEAKYKFITISVSSQSAGLVTFAVDPTRGADGTWQFTVTTLGTEAMASNQYYVQLDLDAKNEIWSTGDTATKYYQIKITKRSVKMPSIIGNTVTTDRDKHVTYSGLTWTDVLQLQDVDADYMNYVLADYITMSDVYNLANDNKLSVSINSNPNTAPYTIGANAGTYAVTVSLTDTNNLMWSDTTDAPLVFNLIIDPIRVARPEIYIPDGSSEGAEGVVGLTKTVTYDVLTGKNYTLAIKNLWYDNSTWRWMSWSVVSANSFNNSNIGTYDSTFFITKAPGYNSGDGSYDKSYSQHGGAYDTYNMGLYELAAKNAGKYILRVCLTPNAVWANGSSDDLEITLVIEKYQYDTPYIYVDNTDTDKKISGTTKTYTYALDVSGAKVTRKLDIYTALDNTVMTQGTIVGLTDLNTADPDNTSGDNYYKYEAQDAGTYTVTFDLVDAANTRWKFADVASMTFTLQINVRELYNPTATNEYLLSNENISVDTTSTPGKQTTTLSVEYDTKQHSLLITNWLDSNYMTYTPNGDGMTTDGHAYFINQHNIATEKTNGTTVGGIYGTTYDGPRKNNLISNKIDTDFLVFTADKIPDKYVITYSLTDPVNMRWKDGTTDDLEFVIEITKMVHATPRITQGTSSTQEYAGGYVYFSISNVYNGIMTAADYAAGTVTTTPYETYTVTGPGGLTISPSACEESWYNGVLILKLVDIGSYTVNVSIDNAVKDWTSWQSGATSVPFTLNVIQRNVNVEFEFRSTDEETDAALQRGSNEWSISAEPYVIVKVSNLVEKLVGGTLDAILDGQIYFMVAGGNPATDMKGLDSVSRTSWTVLYYKAPVQEEDGTWTVSYKYVSIPYGYDASGNQRIFRGNYNIFINQTSSATSNYSFHPTSRSFKIIADPAPFKESLLVWGYSKTSDAPGTWTAADIGMGGDPQHRFVVPFKAGETYTFTAQLNLEGQKGPDGTLMELDFNIGLNNWWVNFGSYSGAQSAINANDYTLSITLTALDSNRYSYGTNGSKTINFYYTIEKAKYNLNDLKWTYDDTNPFTFDGTAKSVSIDATTNPYSQLAISYPASGSYVANQQTYAGKYTTKATFNNADTNYKTPVMGDESTYDGTFAWLCDWEIQKKRIEVEWLEGSSSSNGDNVTKQPVLASFAHLVSYNYWRWDDNLNGGFGDWQYITTGTLDRVPGQAAKFKVEAYLKNNNPLNPTPVNPADPANNYILVFVNGDVNPLEIVYTGSEDMVIYTQITIEDTTNTTFEYTGNPFNAAVTIISDTSGGMITDANLVLNYYVAGSSVPLASAPSAIGNYEVRVKLVYGNNSGVDYYLSQSVYTYSIVKAKFKAEEFEWRYEHQDAATGEMIYARYATDQTRWINTQTGAPVTFVYDGNSHRVYLTSTYVTAGNLTITQPLLKVDAEQNIVSTAAFIFNSNYWEDPTLDPAFTAHTITWTINKAELDMSAVEWDYEDDYIFTLINGVAQPYSAELNDKVPAYLKSKITFTTTKDGDEVSNTQTRVGKFVTVATIDYADINFDNYQFGSNFGGWTVVSTTDAGNPVTLLTSTLNWEIKLKVIDLPQADSNVWSVFDGNIHNLENVFKLDVDWQEYYNISVEYTAIDDEAGENTAEYDGSLTYGHKYMAYDAGKYTLKLSINAGINNGHDDTNVVWRVPVLGSADVLEAGDKTVSHTINKKVMYVTNWKRLDERSTIVLDTGETGAKFIDYEFYKEDYGDYVGNDALLAANKTDLNTVLEAAMGDNFSIVPVVKSAYSGNIKLDFVVTGEGGEYVYFTIPSYDDRGFVLVENKPQIYGYISNGVTTYFDSTMLAEDHVYVIYSGSPVEFLVENTSYVDVWGGDELTQSDAGVYSITYVLKPGPVDDNNKATIYYWGTRPDGTYDRSAVELKFEIKYLMIDIPDVAESIEYTGSEIDILHNAFATESDYDAWLSKFEQYLNISGNKATRIGDYKLYLQIKDEYANMVRFNDGSTVGTVETYSPKWTITPIYLVAPTKNNAVSLVYDGVQHTVYEVLVGYSQDNPQDYLLWLMRNVNLAIEGSRSVNANSNLTAVFSLINSNYAWINLDGSAYTGPSVINIKWEIKKCSIDLSEVKWDYDADKPFEYTVENGQPKVHRVSLINLPEILQAHVRYTTGGIATNGMSAVGTYTTTFSLNVLAVLDTQNYEVTGLPEGIQSLEWKIVEHGFDLPQNNGGWTHFDGNFHDLMNLLGYAEGWENYFEVIVEYSSDGGATYKVLDPFNDISAETNFSIYNGYLHGTYRLTIKIKATLLDSGLVFWNVPEGETVQPSYTQEITVEKMTVTVTGWTEADENSTVIISETLTDEELKLFDYIIYVSDDDKKTPVSAANIEGGIEYTIEFFVKESYKLGIILEGTTTYRFGNYDYGDQPMVWVPRPYLVSNSKVFTGDKQKFEIAGWGDNGGANGLYTLSAAQRNSLNMQYNLGLTAADVRYVYVLGGEDNLTKTSAGTYKAVVRLNSRINLSWYDSSKYKLIGNTLYDILTNTPLTADDMKALTDRSSKALEFYITKAAVEPLDMSVFEDIELVLDYKDGVEQDITKDGADFKYIFDDLTKKYGSLITFDKKLGTKAGGYTLEIRLTDPESSYWALGEVEYKTVSEQGYSLSYIFENGEYTVVYAKFNGDGSYSEYNGGEYQLDLKYVTAYEVEYIDTTADNTKLDADGVPVKQYYLGNDNLPILDNGAPVYEEYRLKSDGKTAMRFSCTPAGKYYIDNNGIFIARYTVGADGKKIAITQDVISYYALFDELATDGLSLTKVPLQNADGTYVNTYVAFDGTNYELRSYDVESDGKFKEDNSGAYVYTVLSNNCDFVEDNGGTVIKYDLVGGAYVAGGTAYLAMYEKESDGSRKQQPVAETDENGNKIIDQAASIVTIAIEKSDTEKVYTRDWSIVTVNMTAPTLKENAEITYTGKEIKLEDFLDGFDSQKMRIESNGTATNAGTYTAVIKLTDPNYKWGGTAFDYVTVEWTVGKATVDLSGITWGYFDNAGNKYTDDTKFTYTRADDKARVYYVGLVGLPEIVKDYVVYTTNEKTGAFAGRNAGRYETTFSVVVDFNNFNPVVIPIEVQSSVVWYINTRTLEIPTASGTRLFFEDKEQTLLSLIDGLPEDWDQYYDIQVSYAADFENYVEYAGYNGDPYKAYAAGAYRFNISIKSELNTGKT